MKFPRVLLVSRCLLEKDSEILLLHRSEQRGYNPDKWELPGGKVEAGQDLGSATEREILEETGLLVKITSPLTFTEAKTVGHGKYKGTLYLELVHEATLVGGRVRLSQDHTEYRWVSRDKVLDFDLSLEARKTLTFFLDPRKN